MRTLTRIVLAGAISIMSLGQLLAATDWKVINYGESATISWSVITAPSCSPSTDYDDRSYSSDPIYNQWTSAVYPSTGSKTLGPAYLTNDAAGKSGSWFSFTCTDGYYGASDTTHLYVCRQGTHYNAAANACNWDPSVASFDATGCTIPSGGNNCDTHVWWSVNNAQSPRVYRDGDWSAAWTGTPGDQWSNFGSIGPGSHYYTLWDVYGDLQTKWVTKACAYGTTWNGSICAPPAVSYMGGAGCTIPSGGRTCNTHVWWGISNAISPRVYLDHNWDWAWTEASGDKYHDFSSYGPGTHYYTAWDVNGDLQTIAVEKVCATGTSWNGTICAPPPTLDYLTGTSCTIPEGGNNCLVRAQWNILYPKEPRVYIDTTFAWGWQEASGDHSTNFGSTGPSTHTFTAWDQGDLRTVTVTKKCVAGTAWNGSACIAPSLVSFSATGCTIPLGRSSCSMNIKWSVADAINPKVFANYDGSTGSYDKMWRASTGDVNNGVKLGPGSFTFSVWDQNWLSWPGITVEKVCAAGSYWNGTVCALPTGSLSATACVIPVGASKCSSTVSYTTDNTPKAAVWVGSTIIMQGTSGSKSSTGIPYSGRTFELRDGTDQSGTLLDTLTVYPVCDTDSMWNGRICAQASGNVTATPSTCSIPYDGSRCTDGVTVSFTTQNTSWATVWANGSAFLGGTSGSGIDYTVPYGTKTYSLLNGNQTSGTELDTVTVTGKCAQGSIWTGSTCAPASGTISANPPQCTIAQGESTCSTRITYSTSNTDGAKVLAGSSVFATGLSGTNLPYNNVPFGSLTFTLKNNASDGDTKTLDTVAVSGICGGANEYDTSKSFCVPPTPVIDPTIYPGTVPYNGPVSITWSIKYPNDSCKIKAVLQKPPTCNATCQATIAAEQTALNDELSTSNTNQNDPNGSRVMSSALTTAVSGGDAKGIKTVNLKYSTEFQFTCDTGGDPGVVSMPAKAVKKMIYVNEKNEG